MTYNKYLLPSREDMLGFKNTYHVGASFPKPSWEEIVIILFFFLLIFII